MMMEAEKSHSDSGKPVASEFVRPETRSSDVRGQEEVALPAHREQFPLLSRFLLLGPSVDDMVPGPICFPQFTKSITNLSGNTLKTHPEITFC